MDEFALWFNILTFTLIFAALGLNYIRLLQNLISWRRWYLAYQAGYAVYLLLATYTFFKMVFLNTVPPWIDTGVNWIRMAVSFFLLVCVPEFISRLRGRSWGWKRHLPALLLLAAFMTVLILFPSLILSAMISGAYNLLFALFTLRGFRAKGLGKETKSFLIISLVCYTVFALLNFVSPFIMSILTAGVTTLAIGLFCGLWGAHDLAWFVLDWRRGGSSAVLDRLPARVEEWNISPREREIIQAMAAGATNKEIADKLFVSLRTVEAHLYSIYRKAGVKNRVELLHRLGAGSGRTS